MPKPFVHLHVHTKYSLLDGACHIEQLCKRAAELEMPAVAMTDHGVMYGMVDFVKTCKAHNIRPIIGCEVYILASAPRGDRSPHAQHHHLVLLAETDEGYRNLARLSSIGFIEGFYRKPRIDKEILRQHAGGLIGLSACMQGEVNALLAEKRLDHAMRAADEYADILGRDNFFLEMQDHGIVAQRLVNEGVRELCRRGRCRAVITNDVHYLHRDHAAAHEIMLAIQTGTVMSDPRRMKYPGDQFYFKSREELAQRFPEDADALDMTAEIAQRCRATIETGKLRFPTFETSPGMPQKECLARLAEEGLKRRYNVPDLRRPVSDLDRQLRTRLDYEIEMIEKTGFVHYFLVVADFVNFARTRGIPVGPGRGSGGGSLVAYALGITDLDPLRFNLIFERFLNPERVSPPDFDIDFCQDRREEVIAYVRNKYGGDRVAQIVTFGQLGAKAVIRDIARVLEIPLDKANALTKMIPDALPPDKEGQAQKVTLSKVKEFNPAFDAACRTDPDLRRIIPFAEALEGLYRNAGVHAAGVVIGDKPLIDIVPLARDKDGNILTQYAKESIEECGLLKMDFLGLKTLTALKEAVDLVRQGHGVSLDLVNLPFDDRKTYDLLSRADTVGVFQVESGGMRQLMRDVGVHNIEDLIAVIALYRPGPMEMLPSYIKRKTGKEKIVYDHPLLEPILRETYGVMVYQEQVQQAANVLAGYSPAEADMLRRAMSKKKQAAMAKERAGFVTGCARTNNIPAKLAKSIFDHIAAFAGYGFNKAHSAGYATLSYQTAYMKANYPAEFMCAQISSVIGNFDELPKFVSEAESMGLAILPPDANRSQARFVPEGQGIRYGLAGIKSVGEGAAAAIVAARAAGGPFSGLVDFCQRLRQQAVNKRAIEALIRCGAMDSFGQHRGRLLGAVDFALARAAEKARETASGQGSLFELFGADAAAGEELPESPRLTDRECLAGERELLGLYISGHPLDRFRRLIRDFQTLSIGALEDAEDGCEVRMAGLSAQVQRRLAKQSKAPWAIMTLDDGERSTEALIFPEAFALFEGACQADQPVLLCGAVSRRNGSPKLIVREVYPLAEAPRRYAARVLIQLPTDADAIDRLQSLRAIVTRFPGKVPLLICLFGPGGGRLVIAPGGNLAIDPVPDFISETESLLGRSALMFLSRTGSPRPISKL